MTEAADDSPTSLTSCKSWEQLLAELRASAAAVREGGGRRNIDRQHAKGRLTARERIELLRDPDSPFVELGLFAGFGRFEAWGGAPSAGLITGVGWIEGRPCMLVVNDATVKAGAFFPPTTKKLLRAQTIAANNRLPLIYLVDSAGVFLPLQDEIFPDQDDFGRIFYNNARISALGVPQLAAIMGSCVAGGAYLPVMCDKILMTEGSGLYIAGPALVKAAIGQQIDSDDLGGARVHAQLSGTADFRAADDESCLKDLRSLVAATGIPAPRYIPAAFESSGDQAAYASLPLDSAPWSAAAILQMLVDAGTARVELEQEGALCASARVGRRKVAVVVASGADGPVAPEVPAAVVEFLSRRERRDRLTLIAHGSVEWPVCRAATELFDYLAGTSRPRVLLLTDGSWQPGMRFPFGKSLDPDLVYAWPTVRSAGWTGASEDVDVRHAEAHLAIDRIIEPALTRHEMRAAVAIVGESRV